MKSRLYRLLLRFFPRDMRAEFGPDMEELFARHRKAARGLSGFRLWMAAAGDAARHGVGARLDRIRRPPQQEARMLMDLLTHDVRYALRMLLKQRSVTAMMLATLALGIGANTAVFSVVNAVLLRPLPYPDPDALAMVYEKRSAEGVTSNSVSPADFLDWRATNQSFSSLASFTDTPADLTGTGEPVQITVGGVTADFFNVLGVRALHGRTFAPDEDVLGQHRVVVLGHALWRQRFGGDPSIVGRQITLNGVAQEVIGVLPPGFEAPKGAIDLWAPLVLRSGAEAPTRTNHFLLVFGRLKSGVGLEAARSELDAIGRRLEEQYPNLSRGHGAHVVALRDDIVVTGAPRADHPGPGGWIRAVDRLHERRKPSAGTRRGAAPRARHPHRRSARPALGCSGNR